MPTTRPLTTPSVAQPRSGWRGPSGVAPVPSAVTPRWFSKPTSQPVPSTSSWTATSPTSRFAARVVAASTSPKPATTPPSAPQQRGADELESGAHREQHRAALDGVVQRARAAERVERGELRRVLAAAEQVDVGVAGDRVGDADLDHARRDAAAFEAAREHERVAAVAVGAEQLREHERDVDDGIRHGARAPVRCERKFV